MQLTPEIVEKLVKSMPHAEAAELLAMFDELEERKVIQAAQSDFLAFIAAIDKAYKFGVHLKRLGALLMDVEEDIKNRIAVSMAPRMGKSQMISIYYPAWYLGRHPDHKVIVASHTSDLAVVMARKVRNLIHSPEYARIFPGTKIASDAKAAAQWNTTAGGEYFAIGVGGALAGRGAHLIIADDPLSEQDIKAGNTNSLDTVYEWFSAGLRTRLMPNGKICVLHCLTGDTKVTMGDLSETRIQDVRPGDTVWSYIDGCLERAKVLGWSKQGLDHIYAVALKSGVIIRGNERHPLLVAQNGVEQWIKIKDLKLGMRLVCVTNPDAPNPTTPGGSVSTTTTKPAEKPQTALPPQAGVSGGGRLAALLAAMQRYSPKGYVLRAATKLFTPNAKPKVATTAPKSGVTRISKCSMGSLELTTTGCLPGNQESVQYAGSLRMTGIPQQRGKSESWLLTTATQLAKSVRSYATLATSWLKSATRQTSCAKPLRTLSITLDEIVAITPDGVEDVYDIQVEGTESFIDNGVVSHNTRWHQRDLIGRLLKDSAMNEGGDNYEAFEFPAILNEGTADEKSIWPEQWTLESLQQTRASMHHIMWQWYAQYQQNPTAAEAAIIKRDWIKWWTHEDPPQCEFLVQAFDTALTTKERSDFSVCHTWGVWFNEEDNTQNVILLNSVKGKYEFPELKQMAHDQYSEWQPDSVVVEAKASGQPLIDEMRRSGIFVQDFSPGKGQDKIARLNAVADMFASGHVWFPETAWAAKTVEEILAFPAGEHDDEVDTMTLALMRVRKGGLLRLSTDHEDNEGISRARRAAYY
jgi:predicted phage terminase large subunit-like protein